MTRSEKPRETGPDGERPAEQRARRCQEELDSLRAKLRQSEARVEALETQLREAQINAPPPGIGEREMRLLAEQLERQAVLLERDEQVGRELQRNLQPVVEGAFEGLHFAIETLPGARVGGDFYDIINLSDNFVAFLIADVSGYGLPAAVIMATGRLAFRTAAASEQRPRIIMENVNRQMLRSTLAGHYLTAFLGVLDTELLTLQYVNASHCSPFLIRDGEVTPLDTEGLFVGMFEDPQYEQKSMQLDKHDRLFLYTDGLLHAFDEKDRPQSQKLLCEYLEKNGALSIEELIGGLTGRLDHPDDDVAVMGVELLLEKAQRKTITMPSLPRELIHAETAILPVLENLGYGERIIFAVKLALEEAVINAIKHGNELDDTKRVTVSFSVDENRAVISVADEGEGFDPNALPDPTAEDYLMATSGRGVALIRAYMDEVRFNDKGTEITMIKYAPWVAGKHS
ncbi:MAG: SpoIIE family protein phosphatase [Candidatus Brocadiaceae bacterium]|nr:SpoIIE family protein phosphatase [Candidatus Brocadiaceae bacterium]